MAWLAPLFLVLLVSITPRLEAQKETGRLAVATEHAASTREALAQLRAQGNAVDAAVTAALVAGVTNPSSSGLGGGGFALVWRGVEQEPFLIDFRETAPQAIDTSAFEARPFSDAARGRYVGVPGELKGLFELHRRFGKRNWAEVVAPAVRLATRGFVVERHLGNVLVSYGPILKKDAGIAGIFYGKGTAAIVGRRVKNPALGKSLELVAAQGPKAFYEGPIAADIVAAANKLGGSLTTDDLRNYRPVERQPIRLAWEGYDVYTMPPPSAGGMMLAQILRLFSKQELKRLGFNTGAYQHMLAEAMRASIADRFQFLGDPEHARFDIRHLISEARMATRKRRFALDLTHAIPRFVEREHGTHHLVTADAAGNVVSLTTTVNRAFGAKLSGESSGVVLNDELDDFTARADIASLGLAESPNRPRAGARPVSSMTPTIVVQSGRPVLALGGSGGMAIATNVIQVLLSNLAFDHSPEQAVMAPRFYIPTQLAFIQLEPNASAEHVRDLERRGEIVGTTRFLTTAVQLITIDDKGTKRVAADQRKHGSAQAR